MDWFEKMRKAAEESLQLPDSLKGEDEKEGVRAAKAEHSRLGGFGEKGTPGETSKKDSVSERRKADAGKEDAEKEDGRKEDAEKQEDAGQKDSEKDAGQREEKGSAERGSAEASSSWEEAPKGIEDWTEAMAMIACLREEKARLEEREKALKEALRVQKEARRKDREETACKLELIGAGALDADYLVYKMGKEAAFDETGDLMNGDELVKEAKKRFPSLFRGAAPLSIEGVKPGDGGMGGGRRPDTGFLTYSQERRLRERG